MWIETTKHAFWYRPKNSVVYGDTSVPANPMPAPDAWNLKPLTGLPEWAKFVGLRIWTPVQRPISAPNANTNLTITLRRPGDTTINIGDFVAQAQCLVAEAGERDNTLAWVGLDESFAFEWAWQRNPLAGDWPTGCSYGVNMEALEIAG